MATLRDQLANARRGPVSDTVNGVTIWLRTWTTAEGVSYMAATRDDAPKDRHAEEALLRSLCDEAGARVYGDDEADALRADIPGGEIVRLGVRALGLNGMIDDTKSEPAG